ncbi:hypothetical protein [Puniceibacterium sediminis]|uniref:Uncharacterized protein n=1 Tax=Puniceibacterium sediminis TaxID=1608407 RepID=A0A238UVH3_9RHOB|nr:hypothetical protein [Puniceibacterium sediminis]SNR25737.1 hypothetical protein SAMN06265370_101142 [Puniceibacterium sediminis]
MRFLPATLLLCACAQFPELDSTQTPGVADAPYPRLVPIETLLVSDPPRATPEMRAGVLARAEALRARAALLVGPVVDAQTQSRMESGVPETE